MYYYVIDEYRVSNQLLTEDIYVRCRPSTTRLKPSKLLWMRLIVTDYYIGPPVRGTTDRRLRQDSRGTSQYEEAISEDAGRYAHCDDMKKEGVTLGSTAHVEWMCITQDEFASPDG